MVTMYSSWVKKELISFHISESDTTSQQEACNKEEYLLPALVLYIQPPIGVPSSRISEILST